MAINYGSGRLTATISTNTTWNLGVYEYQNLTINAGIILTVPNDTILLVKGTLALNGTIEVAPIISSGGIGGIVTSGANTRGGDGGAAGGNITVIANAITGSGTIRAKGVAGTASVVSTTNYGNDYVANSFRSVTPGSPFIAPFAYGANKLPASPIIDNTSAAYEFGGVAYFYGIANKIDSFWDYLQNGIITKLKQGGFTTTAIQAGGGSGGSSGGASSTYTGAGGPGGAGGTMFGVGGSGGYGDGYQQNSGTGYYEGSAGAGGGGAGGMILLVCPSTSSTLNLDVSGGAGGTAPPVISGGNAANPRGGGGGGGGGGIILSFTERDLYTTSNVAGGAFGLKSSNTGSTTAPLATDGSAGSNGLYLYLNHSTYLL